MAQHHVDIGAHVKSSDGKDLGKVEQLILRGESNRVGGFLLSKHLFSTEKIVPARLVDLSSTEQVTLTIPASEVESLDNYVHEQFVRAPGELTYGVGMGGLVDIGGTGDTWVLRGSDGGQYPHTGTAPFFFEAPIGNVEVENVSSLSDDSILINEGTDVIGSDGKKVGHIDEVLVDDNGQISELLVKAGWLFKHDVHIPIALVAGTTSDHVRLSVTAEEAEAQSRPA